MQTDIRKIETENKIKSDLS